MQWNHICTISEQLQHGSTYTIYYGYKGIIISLLTKCYSVGYMELTRYCLWLPLLVLLMQWKSVY